MTAGSSGPFSAQRAIVLGRLPLCPASRRAAISKTEGNERMIGGRFHSRLLDEAMVGRQRAGRIGGRRHAGQVKCLAATASEVDGAPLARSAWLGHPLLTA